MAIDVSLMFDVDEVESVPPPVGGGDPVEATVVAARMGDVEVAATLEWLVTFDEPVSLTDGSTLDQAWMSPPQPLGGWTIGMLAHPLSAGGIPVELRGGGAVLRASVWRSDQPAPITDPVLLVPSVETEVVISATEPTVITGQGATRLVLVDKPDGWLVVATTAQVGEEEFLAVSGLGEQEVILGAVAFLLRGPAAFEGSSVLGRYQISDAKALEVTGLRGPWELVVTPVDLLEPIAAPVTVEGTGTRAFVVDGDPSRAIVSGNIDTGRTFHLAAFGPDNATEMFLVYTDKAVASEAVKLPTGLNLFLVESQTDWTIEFLTD